MVTFDKLDIDDKYDRPYLAKLWGYDGHQAIARGIFTPAKTNIIILFITKKNQDCLTKYVNYFEEAEKLLYMNGETSHLNDERLINSDKIGDEIYLFYRDIHHSPFTYKGRVYLSYFTINSDKPSNFVFSTSKLYAQTYNNICCEKSTYNDVTEIYASQEEGKSKTVQYTVYERSLKNRSKAIELHGTTCFVCGFNFNDFYGEKLANDYIEIHHITPLNQYEGRINPQTDLIPVCPNCHRMLHRNKNTTLSIQELKTIINNNRNFTHED